MTTEDSRPTRDGYEQAIQAVDSLVQAGAKALEQNEPARARAWCAQALQVLRRFLESEDRLEREIQVQIFLVEALWREGDNHEALTICEDSCRIAEKLVAISPINTGALVLALILLAQARQKVDDGDGAVSCCETALDRLDAVGGRERLPGMYVMVLQHLGQAYRRVEQYTLATESLLKAERVCQVDQDLYNHLPGILLDLGNVYVSSSQFRKAEQCYIEGIAASDRLAGEIDTRYTKDQQARLHAELANALAAQGRLREALGKFDEAISIWRSIGSLRDVAEVYSRQAQLYVVSRKYAKSQSVLDKAVEIQRDQQDTEGLAFSLELKGRILCALHKETQALPLFIEAARCRESVGDFDWTARLYSLIGGIYLDTGQYDDAITCCNKALSVGADSLDDDTVFMTYETMAEACALQGNFVDAQRHIEAAIAVLELGEASAEEASFTLKRMYVGKGHIASELKDTLEAIRSYEHALAISAGPKGKLLDVAIHSELFKLYRESGDTAMAEACRKQARGSAIGGITGLLWWWRKE